MLEVREDFLGTRIGDFRDVGFDVEIGDNSTFNNHDAAFGAHAQVVFGKIDLQSEPGYELGVVIVHEVHLVGRAEAAGPGLHDDMIVD